MNNLNIESNPSSESTTTELASSTFDGKKTQNETKNILDFNKKNTGNKSVLKIEYNELIGEMNQNDFEQFILDILANNPQIEKLDLTDIFENDSKIHSYTHNIIGNNYPLLEIMRLLPGQRVINIIFSGVKKLNDTIGQNAVDLFIEKLKELLNGNFSQKVENERIGRIVRGNYKHITYSMDNKVDISQKIFPGINSIDELIDQVTSKISLEELIENLPKYLKDSMPLDSFNKLFKYFFKIGVGTSIVEGTDNESKLLGLYKAEMKSRNRLSIDNLSNNAEFNFKVIKNSVEYGLKTERELIAKYKGEKFFNDGVGYEIILDGKLNNILLEYVRKGKKVTTNISPETFESKVQEYLSFISNGTDFISPVIYEEDYEDIDEINEQIRTGLVNPQFFTHNHKKSLNKKWLNTITKGKKGLKIFIDIVGMGMLNFEDFRGLAEKIDNGVITEKNISKLLEAGLPVTEKFQILVKEIIKEYSGAKIYIGGDELNIFIPDKTEDEQEEIIDKISNSIGQNSLRARILTSTNIDSVDPFTGLENLTKINKFFEEKLLKTVNIFKFITGTSIVTHTNIKSNKLSQISKKLDIFLNYLNNYIAKDDLLYLLHLGESINTEIDETIIDNNGKTINFKVKINILKNDGKLIINIE